MFARYSSALLAYFIGFWLPQALIADGAKRGPWDVDLLFKTPAYRESAKAKKPGAKALLYCGLPYNGRPTEVFAYYAAPKGNAPKSGWPAVVCIHGGGGTAFDVWVKKWNKHGYAAISMDLEGHYPLKKAPVGKQGGREPVERPGPSRVGVFHDFGKLLEQQWYYHAVAQVILAHSLIRSFPEVDADRTGVTGISWGGILTSTVIGIDDRFKFAVPVYGCGFLPGSEGHQGRAIRAGKHREMVEKYYDGSAYFHNVKIPTLWINGTNDFHFSLVATQKSAQAVCGPSTVLYVPRMRHGHIPGWSREEIYAFADSVVKNGVPLPQLGKPQIAADIASCEYTAATRIKRVEPFYTGDTCSWPDRKWRSVAAEIAGNKLTANVPEGAVAVFFSVTDERGLNVTSFFAEIPGK